MVDSIVIISPALICTIRWGECSHNRTVTVVDCKSVVTHNEATSEHSAQVIAFAFLIEFDISSAMLVKILPWPLEQTKQFKVVELRPSCRKRPLCVGI